MASLEELIADAQEVVGSQIKKPKLSEKLLGRPPFRFLHDVVMALNAKSGFVDALLSDEEKDSGNIKDKATKLAFLDKIVDFASACHGAKLMVRSSKIVAGLEPEHTNALLIALGKASADESVDYTRAAAQALGEDIEPVNEGKATDEAEKSDGIAEAAVKEEERYRHKERRRAREREEEEATVRAEDHDKKEQERSASSGGKQFDTLSADGEVRTTIELFQGLITKPKLSEKLLSKPPFRFLHDVMSSLSKATGLLEGLYTTEEETNSRTCSESKERKLAFLDKAIAFANACAPEAGLSVKSNRVVAGHEADNTNHLLQVLALIARNNCNGVIPGNEAIDRVLGKVSPATPAKKEKKKKAVEHAPKQQEERQEVVPLGSEVKEPELNESKDDEASIKPLARPQTARKRPPKIKEKATEVAGKGGAGGGRPVDGPVGVMMDGQDSDDDDDNNNDGGDGNPATDGLVDRERRDSSNHDGALKGKLAREILDDEQKNAAEQKEGSSSEENTAGSCSSATAITMGKIGQGMNRRGTKLGGSSTMGVIHVDKISGAIQTLCQSTNPLGKCMDHIHDDLATMSKELERWRTDYRKSCDDIEDERRATNETLHPLQGKLLDVKERIKDEQAKLFTLNASIAKNDQRIAELLRDMVLN